MEPAARSPPLPPGAAAAAGTAAAGGKSEARGGPRSPAPARAPPRVRLRAGTVAAGEGRRGAGPRPRGRGRPSEREGRGCRPARPTTPAGEERPRPLPVGKPRYLPCGDLRYRLPERRSDAMQPPGVALGSGNARRRGAPAASAVTDAGTWPVRAYCVPGTGVSSQLLRFQAPESSR
ncbi:translation initiation factor IF-2-like [Vulpes lagopus]|uniref:translation initiation factor IF-2-like n=1 Tax=Vulpes lagopus TaxID=494514 RepID=UPI001BCA1F0A|nr:translation initiation factor IF-2-like [Vulpes lagopus]